MQTNEHHFGPNNLFVLETIPDEKKYEHPVVFVHGSFGNHMMWMQYIKAFAMAGFHTFALTLRGHAPSGGEISGVTMQNYSQDIKAVVDGANLANPVIIGHSMSGLVALIYGQEYGAHKIISIDPSPSKELQSSDPDEEKIAAIPDIYNAIDAGMPTDPSAVMKALSDISPEMMMSMKDMLGPESGAARRDRKRGVSIEKPLPVHTLMIAAELGDSISFGISHESTQKMAEYYDADLFSVQGATHPGILLGKHASETAQTIVNWLIENEE